ncbi:MAG: hypothetical protein WB798_01510 [Nocardioidaceae bacterium]
MCDGMERRWTTFGVRAAVVGMACWVVGIALFPVDAQLHHGDERLAALLRAGAGRQYVATDLALIGGVLLVVFLVALTQIVPDGAPGAGLLRLSLAGCVVTQSMVGCGAGLGLAAVHASVARDDPALVALAWRGLWLTWLASAAPTVLFTAAAVLGLRQAGLSPRWVAGLGWVSVGAHVLVLFTVAQLGLFAPDGLVGGMAPATTVVWVLALALTLTKAHGRVPRPSTAGGRAAAASRDSRP